MDTKKNYVCIMNPHDADKPFTVLTNNTKKGRTYELSGGQEFSYNMLISKVVTLLVSTTMFNKDISE